MSVIWYLNGLAILALLIIWLANEVSRGVSPSSISLPADKQPTDHKPSEGVRSN